jgi:hypothetical protein
MRNILNVLQITLDGHAMLPEADLGTGCFDAASVAR